MSNFKQMLSQIDEGSSSPKIPWKKRLSGMNGNSWGLYSGKVSDKAGKAMTKEMMKLLAAAFKTLSAGEITINQMAKDVYMDFSKFKKQYYKEGAEDSEVEFMTKKIIGDAFGIGREIF